MLDLQLCATVPAGLSLRQEPRVGLVRGKDSCGNERNGEDLRVSMCQSCGSVQGCTLGNNVHKDQSSNSSSVQTEHGGTYLGAQSALGR